MKTNKIVIGSLVGGIAFFFLGWIVYGMFLMNFMKEHQNQCAMRPMEEMIWWPLILGNIVWALAYAVIFSWSNITSFAGGLKAGIIIGFLIGASFDLSFYSMSTMFSSLTAVVVDILAGTAMSGIGGGIIATVMGMGKKEG